MKSSFQDSDQMQPGETMFQYLKRKKKSMLKESIEKSKNKNNIKTKRDDRTQDNQQQNYEEKETRRYGHKWTLNKQNTPNQNYSRDNSQSKNTPNKHVTFFEQERKSRTKSFLKMISPLRNKQTSQYKQAEKIMKKSPIRQRKGSYQENYTRKMLMEKMSNLRQTVQKFLRAGKSLKQKSHFLFIDMKPFLRHMEKCDESGIQKRTQQIKAKLKTFQYFFKDFDVSNSEEQIDEFYKYFSQHLNELQGHKIQQIQQNKISFNQQIQATKNAEIDELKAHNYSLNKQIDNLSKKIEKMETSHEKLFNQHLEKYEKNKKIYQQKIQSLEIKLEELLKQTQKIDSEKSSLQNQVSFLENDLKNINFSKQKTEKQFINTLSKVKTQQQQVLLNEIISLKKQFNADISQMNSLFSKKEEQYVLKIRQLSQQNEKTNLRMEQVIEHSLKVQENSASAKAAAARFKKQNQYIATDMHRINEELYQHWLALKDIKTLSLRLQIYQKFKKIFDQLSFNQQLFF